MFKGLSHTTRLTGPAFPITHRRSLLVSGCSGSLSPSWKYLYTTAVPQLSLTELGYRSRQASPCQVPLCRQATAGGSVTCCTSPMEGGRRAHDSCMLWVTSARCYLSPGGCMSCTFYRLQRFLKLHILFPFSTVYLKHCISGSPDQFFQCSCLGTRCFTLSSVP